MTLPREGSLNGGIPIVPRRGQGRHPDRFYGAAVTSANVAAPVRLVLTAIILAFLAALLVAGRANGGGRAWSAYLAPAAACQGSSNPAAAPAVQGRAIGCLVNWARIQDRRSQLAQPSALRHAAALKGRRIVSYGQVSHTPCGTGVTASLRATGYRYSGYGEHLSVGDWARPPHVTSSRRGCSRRPTARTFSARASEMSVPRRLGHRVSSATAAPSSGSPSSPRRASDARKDSPRGPGRTGPVREESHLDDMRSAIRDDFERLAERRGEQKLMRVSAEEPEPVAELLPEAPARRSWLARLLSP